MRYLISAILIVVLLLASFATLAVLVSSTRLESRNDLEQQHHALYYEGDVTARPLMSLQEAKPADSKPTDTNQQTVPTSKKPSKKDAIPVSAKPTHSAEAPTWGKERKHRIEDQTHYFIVETEITSPETVDDEIDQAAVQAIQKYIERNFGDDCAKHVHVDPAYVRKHMYSRIHIRELTKEKASELLNGNKLNLEDLDYSVGYAEVRCDPNFNLMIARSWQKQKRFSRLQQFGLIGLSVLALLGIAFGFFASDKATRGMYTVRLQLGSVALVIVTALILWAVAVQIEWI